MDHLRTCMNALRWSASDVSACTWANGGWSDIARRKLAIGNLYLGGY